MAPDPGLLAVSFAADGEAIVAVSSNDAVVHLIDTRTGDVSRRIQLPDVAGNDCHAVASRHAMLAGGAQPAG